MVCFYVRIFFEALLQHVHNMCMDELSLKKRSDIEAIGFKQQVLGVDPYINTLQFSMLRAD